VQHRPEVLRVFEALAVVSDIAAPLSHEAGHGSFSEATGLGAICTALRLPQSRAAHVEAVLTLASQAGLFERCTGLTWRTCDAALAKQVAPLLSGAALYRTRVHEDENTVQVILTKPPAPSQMAARLEGMLSGGWGLRDTRELLPSIAEGAKSSFSVITPYLDEVGAEIVLNLFERARCPAKSLILRCGSDGLPPPGLTAAKASLGRLGVDVLNFRLGREVGPGNETFHAKVVLADDTSAYVGSANMHRWSFEYSLELGVYVQGKAVRRISEVVAAIAAVSSPM